MPRVAENDSQRFRAVPLATLPAVILGIPSIKRFDSIGYELLIVMIFPRAIDVCKAI